MGPEEQQPIGAAPPSRPSTVPDIDGGSTETGAKDFETQKVSLEERGAVVDGGSTEAGVKDFETQPVSLEEREADHRRGLAVHLIWLLTVVSVLFPVGICVMVWNGKSHEGLSTAFNTLLPVIAGLAGSAVTYFFTRPGIGR